MVTPSCAVLGSVTMDGPATPPWRLRAFRAVTAAAGFDDAAARRLFLDALAAADALPTVDAAAEALGVSKRTLQRARGWLEDYDPDAFAALRTRAPDPKAAALARWGKGREGV